MASVDSDRGGGDMVSGGCSVDSDDYMYCMRGKVGQPASLSILSLGKGFIHSLL